MDVSDVQWSAIKNYFPSEELRAPGRRGGRPWACARSVLNGVMWVPRTGAPWREMPRYYPAYQTCHRRFQRWCRHGLFERVLRKLAVKLEDDGALDLSESYIDGTHVAAKRGGLFVGRTRGGKNTKIMAVADRNGLPIAATIASGERHETQLVAQTLRACFAPGVPSLRIGDKAYDSDALDDALLSSGVELVAPHVRSRKHKTQDGRRLRRYRRRWRIERCFAWSKRFRRLTNRWEHKAENFLGFVRLGCVRIILRRLRDALYSVWEGGRIQSVLFWEDQPFLFQRSYAADTSQGYFIDCVMDIQTGRRKCLSTNRDSQVSDYEGHHFERNAWGLAIRRGRRVNNLETYQTGRG